MAARPDTGPALTPLQQNLQNASNSVSRQAFLQAAACRAPRLLLFAPWTCRTHVLLVIQRSPSRAPPVFSQRGVFQGDPCGPLFFDLTSQDALENMQRTFSDVRVVTSADDVHLQGPPLSVSKAFCFLVTATAEIGLSPSLSKCAAHARSADTSAATATALGITHHPEKLVAASTLLGADTFVEADAGSRSAAAASLLTSPLLPTQEKFLWLGSFLQARLAWMHLFTVKEAVIAALCCHHAVLSSLQSLDLQDNNLKAAGAAALGLHLAALSSL
jgi:hypothetical protein